MRSKNTKYIILLCISLLLLGICIILNFVYEIRMQDDSDILEQLRDSIKQFDTSVTTPEDTEPTDTSDTADPSVNTGDTVDSQTEDVTGTQPGKYDPEHLDFDVLWEINPEICAWLEIDGTKIDYPVLQSKGSDKKYLTTAYDGSPYIGGALFTEGTYNSSDFNDPVTIIYGHTMRAGTLFGQLQRTYSVKNTYELRKEIKLYLPGEIRKYTVFAAVPYSNIHVLHTYDFSNGYWYNRFFKDVFSIREIGANFTQGIVPEPDDRVLMLSVCLNEDTTRRFLVMAVFNGDLKDNSEDIKG